MRGRILPGYQNVNRNVWTGSLDRNMIRWQHSKSLSNLSPFFKTLLCNVVTCVSGTHIVKNTLTNQISTLTLTSPAFHSTEQPQRNEEAASGGIFLQITPNLGLAEFSIEGGTRRLCLSRFSLLCFDTSGFAEEPPTLSVITSYLTIYWEPWISDPV